jgi:hypothetical protein
MAQGRQNVFSIETSLKLLNDIFKAEDLMTMAEKHKILADVFEKIDLILNPTLGYQSVEEAMLLEGVKNRGLYHLDMYLLSHKSEYTRTPEEERETVLEEDYYVIPGQGGNI